MFQTPQPNVADDTPQKAPGMGLTWSFIIVLVIIYGITSYPGFAHIQNWAVGLGAMVPHDYRGGIAEGHWWRWITANLLHADLMHLLMNCFGLYIFGQSLEPVLGKRRMLTLYLFGAAGCDLVTWQLSKNISIGASGIDYALIGAYFMLILLYTLRHEPRKFGESLRGVLMLMALYIYSDLSRPQVNIWGHVGGALGGVLYANMLYFLAPKLPPPEDIGDIE